MSTDLLLLCCIALLTAYGFWASLRNAPRAPLAWIAATLYLFVGIQTAILITLEGTGELLPGRMLNPAVQNYWSALVAEGAWPQPRPWYVFFAILAHLLAVGAARTKQTALLPLPATLFFCALFFAVRPDRETIFERGVGPMETAYLMSIAESDRTELILCSGPEEATFLPILHRAEVPKKPPEPKLTWTYDGKVVLLETRGSRAFFAVTLDGTTAGWLPTGTTTWPDRVFHEADSRDYQRMVKEAQVDVARLVKEHGGKAKEQR